MKYGCLHRKSHDAKRQTPCPSIVTIGNHTADDSLPHCDPHSLETCASSICSPRMIGGRAGNSHTVSQICRGKNYHNAVFVRAIMMDNIFNMLVYFESNVRIDSFCEPLRRLRSMPSVQLLGQILKQHERTYTFRNERRQRHIGGRQMFGASLRAGVLMTIDDDRPTDRPKRLATAASAASAAARERDTRHGYLTSEPFP